MTTRDVAFTQRTASTSIFGIDSEDRFADWTAKRAIDGPSPYNFTITRNAALINGFFTRLAVSEVCFPWTIPNINPKTAKVMLLTQVLPGPAPIVSIPLTIEPGFYTPNELAAALQVAVRAANPALAAATVTYGINNLPIFSYNSATAAMAIGFAPMAQDVTIGPLYYPYGPRTKQLFDVLGFNTTNSIPVANTIYDGGATYAQATRYIDICCPRLVANQGLYDATTQAVSRDMLCRLYLGDAGMVTSALPVSDPSFCPPGCRPTTIYRQYTNPKWIQWNAAMPVASDISFQIYDDNGEPLADSDPFDNASYNDWSMTVLITEN